jgi:hypothetical protein
MYNMTTNLRAKLLELVERKDTDALRILLVAYLGHRRHETMIRLAIANIEQSVKIWSELR